MHFMGVLFDYSMGNYSPEWHNRYTHNNKHESSHLGGSMDKGKEPVFTEVTLTPEEIAQRKEALMRKRAAAARASGTSPAAAASASKQTLATVAFIFAVAAAAFAGFLFMQLQSAQQKLAGAEQLLNSQAKTLHEISEKLSVTGENANLSVDALKVIIKDHDAEIRKLWDLANKRNRGDIVTNAKNIEAVKASVAANASAANKEIEKQQKQLAANEAADAELKKRMAKAETRLTSVADAEIRLAQQSEAIQALNNEIARLKKSGLGADATDIRLQLEDINIRLDRMQAALGQ